MCWGWKYSSGKVTCNKFIQVFLTFKYHIRVLFFDIGIIFYTAKDSVVISKFGTINGKTAFIK